MSVVHANSPLLSSNEATSRKNSPTFTTAGRPLPTGMVVLSTDSAVRAGLACIAFGGAGGKGDAGARPAAGADAEASAGAEADAGAGSEAADAAAAVLPECLAPFCFPAPRAPPLLQGNKARVTARRMEPKSSAMLLAFEGDRLMTAFPIGAARNSGQASEAPRNRTASDRSEPRARLGAGPTCVR